ncbi:DUF167 domain-containing protein [Paracoccus jeotgali]|uniref:DUF167 domain-containing protein n=1 Tax=Paracoccus jeotgali TaxID=2065379 RepID=UPI0028AA0266|nr:DUF167 domain-containing protein [Paracoccus jeotgali]
MSDDLPDLRRFVTPDGRIEVRVTPKAARNRLVVNEHGALRAYVTAAPEQGKATRAVAEMLAKALAVPKTRVVLARGAASRDKSFRLLD